MRGECLCCLFAFLLSVMYCVCSLRLISPVIKEHGIDYERGKFQDKLDNGSLTLQRTEVWDCMDVDEMFDIFIYYYHHHKLIPSLIFQKWIRDTVSSKPASMVTDLVAGKASAFVNVHTSAMISLIASSVPVTLETTPETLMFDVHRLSLIQQEFARLVNGATALVIANHAIIGSDKTPSAEKRQVISGLSDLLASGGFFNAAEFCSNLDSAGVLVDAEARNKFLKSVTQSTENVNDPVRQLM